MIYDFVGSKICCVDTTLYLVFGLKYDRDDSVVCKYGSQIYGAVKFIRLNK